MSTLRFTPDHEWLRTETDGSITVGITHYAQEALGDLVFVQLPALRPYGAGEEVVVLESVKAAGGINMPLAGEVIAVNKDLEQAPQHINEDAQGKGWCFRFRPTDAAGLSALLDQAGYDKLVANS